MVGIGSNPFGTHPLLAQLLGNVDPLGLGVPAQDPAAALLGFFAQLQGQGQGGAGADMRALRQIVRQLDRAIVERLLSGGFSPDALSGLVQGNLQSSTPQLGGPALFNGLPGQLPFPSSCFPQQQLFDCFPCAARHPCAPSPWPQIPGVPSPGPGGQPQLGKTFDVWFESRDGQKATQRSPIVLDLNGNGRPDLTGNVGVENGRWVAKGQGKVDFDIDPTKRSWSTKSVQRRPGSGAPAVPGGYAKVYDDQGTLLRDKVPLGEALGKGGGKGGITTGRAEVFDQNGQLVGEYKKDADKKQYMYHWGNRKDAERTEWMAPGGADGLLVWDNDGNGKIESSKELFGEFDVDGTKRFNNGYEKLAAHFDLNRDGAVTGMELERAKAMGVKVWRDVNGDGKTDAGELQSLDQHQVRALGTQVNPTDMSSAYVSGGGLWPWPKYY